MPVKSSGRHERMKYGDIKLYAGTSCPELATRIATHMNLPLMRTGYHLSSPMTTCLCNCIPVCAGRIVMSSKPLLRLCTAT